MTGWKSLLSFVDNRCKLVSYCITLVGMVNRHLTQSFVPGTVSGCIQIHIAQHQINHDFEGFREVNVKYPQPPPPPFNTFFSLQQNTSQIRKSIDISSFLLMYPRGSWISLWESKIYLRLAVFNFDQFVTICLINFHVSRWFTLVSMIAGTCQALHLRLMIIRILGHSMNEIHNLRFWFATLRTVESFLNGNDTSQVHVDFLCGTSLFPQYQDTYPEHHSSNANEVSCQFPPWFTVHLLQHHKGT